MTPVAVGIDLVEVERVRAAVERTPSLEARVFTPGEIAYCRSARDPWHRFAARWAAKEAVVKCLGGGVPGLDLTEIEIAHDASGAPTVTLRGDAAVRASERGVATVLVSLTHDGAFAEAVAIGVGPGVPPAHRPS